MGKIFHIGDLLSVTDRYLVSPNHIHGVYDVIDYVTGEAHFTHQLPRAAEVVKPWLLEQHPWLAEIEVPDGLDSEAKVLKWLEDLTAKYPAHHTVEPMPFGMYVGREPIVEARELAPQAQIITIDDVL